MTRSVFAWFEKLQPNEIPFIKKHALILLCLVLAFAFLSRVALLGAPPTFYFDEKFHAFTAREILNGNPDAWTGHGPRLKGGFAYDWVEPPFAKLAMAGGMAVFGENAIGWRLPGALFGVGAVLFVYLLGVLLFKNTTLGLLGASIFALDGLPVVMSRLGTNDSIFLFMALGTVYFFLKGRHLLAAVFFGLAAATKLSFVLIPIVLLALLLILRQKPGPWLAWYVIIPPVVYLLTFIPFFTIGHTVPEFIALHLRMISYHLGLQATHAFQSAWWTWPLMLKPMLLHVRLVNDLVVNIAAHGNPVVFWVGLLALPVVLVAAIVKKQRALWILLAGYMGFFIPWALSPRIMFIYHYLPSIPFLSLGLAWLLLSTRHWKKVALVFLILAGVFFILFYPRWAGIAGPEWLHNVYSCLPTLYNQTRVCPL